MADQARSYSDQCRQACLSILACRGKLRDAGIDVAELELTRLVKRLSKLARELEQDRDGD